MLIYVNPNEKTKMTNPVLSIDKEELTEAPNTSADEAKAPDGYVEVGLLLVFTNHYPYRDVRGFLDFKLEKEHQEIKVYIPMEATKSKGSLKKYVYKRLRDEDIDTVSIVDVNIWDEEGDDIEFDFADFQSWNE